MVAPPHPFYITTSIRRPSPYLECNRPEMQCTHNSLTHCSLVVMSRRSLMYWCLPTAADAASVRQSAVGEESPPSRLSALRHSGTRVVPVFILSLAHAPEDVALSTRQLVAANHDAVVVLQVGGRGRGASWATADLGACLPVNSVGGSRSPVPAGCF